MMRFSLIVFKNLESIVDRMVDIDYLLFGLNIPSKNILSKK
jgi:hypothetical protein